MKAKNTIFLIFTVLIMSLCFYMFYSPSALKAKKNVENIKKVKIGVGKIDVIRVMGIPDAKTISFLNNTDSMYYYEPPFAASDGIYVQFDSSGGVNRIVDFE